MSPEIQLGQLVCSMAGRDKDRFFIVVAQPDENFVYIADGDLRKVENPKRKNRKHLRVFNSVAADLVEKMRNGKKITNQDLRVALNKFGVTSSELRQ